MTLRAVGLVWVIVAAALLPASGGAAPQGHRMVTITAYGSWVGRGSCPAGEQVTAPQRVALPHPGKPVTLTFSGEIPSRCGGFSVGVKTVEPVFPINVTTVQQVAYPNENECRQPPLPACQWVLTLTLNAEPACECTSLKVRVKGGVNVSDPDLQGRANLKMTLQWTIGCSGGRIGDCAGTLRVMPPAGTDIQLRSPANGRVRCKGTCSRPAPKATTSTGTILLEFTSKKNLLSANRANKAFRFRFKETCLGALPGDPVRPIQPTTLTIAFGPTGFSDPKRSDLNGDGKPDRGVG